jgi:hypothetical protein
LKQQCSHAIDFLFFLLVFTLIFSLIPKSISLDLIGGVMGSKLGIYPLIAGLFITLFSCIKNNHSKVDSDIFSLPVKRYLIALLLIQLISLILGVWRYPYIDLAISQSNYIPERLLKVLTLANVNQMEYVRISTWVWFGFKGIKNIIANSFWELSCAFFVYFWYKNRGYRCVNLFFMGILASLIVIFLYESVELMYLLGSESAKDILQNINPFIHQIGLLNEVYTGQNITAVNAYAWWPPLLWKHQVRSVFPEPSFFGVYCAFVMPWLWYGVWGKKDNALKFSQLPIWLWTIVIFFMTFFVFLTKSRTALLLYIGEVGLLGLFCIFSSKWRNIKKFILILCLTFLSFAASLAFLQVETSRAGLESSSLQNGNENSSYSASQNVNAYVSENVSSAFSKNQRSNLARLSLMTAELKLWTEYPVLGVGVGMKPAYIPDRFPVSATQSSEVLMWIHRLQDNGPLRAGFPVVSDYTSRLCETGLLGVVVYYFPIFYLMFKMAILSRKNSGIKEKECLGNLAPFFLISLAGMMAGGITTALNITYCLWVLVGLGFVMIHRFKVAKM